MLERIPAISRVNQIDSKPCGQAGSSLLLLVLQTHGQLTAAELAERLEVSERTVRRDALALAEAGIPIVSVRGRPAATASSAVTGRS